MAVRFYDQEVRSSLKAKRRLTAFIESLIYAHKARLKDIDLTYVFCTDAYLLQINKEFLDHDTLTDIITFDMSEGEDKLDGEIYISMDRVRENAAGFGVTVNFELHRVIFHGALHLCGFKDKKNKDKEEMRRQEDICLEAYFNG